MMFNIDPSMILLCLVVPPVIALICGMSLADSHCSQLPYQTWLMRLPGYKFFYTKSLNKFDLTVRSMWSTLAWLGCFYLSVLVFLGPFLNKLLGMTAWFLSVPVDQKILVVIFDLCLAAICYSLFTVVKELWARSNSGYHSLIFAGMSFACGAAITFSMSTAAREVVLLACKTTMSGLFGFFFFGALLFSLNDNALETRGAEAEVGSRILNLFLILLSVGSLVSVLV